MPIPSTSPASASEPPADSPQQGALSSVDSSPGTADSGKVSRKKSISPALRQSPIAVWLVWALAHAIQTTIIVALGWGSEDLHYYRTGEAGVSTAGPPSDAVPLTEYPHAGAWPIYLVRLISNAFSPDSEFVFIMVFVAMCTVLSGAFLWFLLHTSRFNGAWLWVGVCLLIGPILSSRLDLISGIFLGLSVAIVAFHPIIAGGLLAFATASKLWPGVLAVTFVGRWNIRATWSRIIAFFASLAVLVGITVVTSGFERVLSPLEYQDMRGLQVESIAATPFTFLAVFSDKWQIDYTSSKSYEISGPGVDVGISLANLLMAATIVLALAVALWRFLRGGWTRNRALAFAGVLVALLIVSNKVFSPQYVLWIAPIVCLGVPRFQPEQTASSTAAQLHVQHLGYVLLVIAAFSFLIFPITYSWLVLEGPKLVAVLLLVARNIAMLAATVLTLRWWIATERAEPEISGVPLRAQARAL